MYKQMERHDVKEYVFDCLKASAGVVVVAVLFKMIEPGALSSQGSVARTLMDQAAKWHQTAMQDSELLYKLQHTDYAIAYLHAARHAADDTTLERLSGYDVHTLQRAIEKEQKQALKTLASQSKTQVKRESAWIS